MTNLNPELGRFGKQGFWLAQLDGSLCPKTGGLWPDLYDDEVTGFCWPHAEGESVMFRLATI